MLLVVIRVLLVSQQFRDSGRVADGRDGQESRLSICTIVVKYRANIGIQNDLCPRVTVETSPSLCKDANMFTKRFVRWTFFFC